MTSSDGSSTTPDLTDDDLRLGPDGLLAHKNRIKAKLKPHLWDVIEGSIATLADDCRARGIPLACLVVPRAGLADAPGNREVDVARYAAIASENRIPLLDLTPAFDTEDANALALAPWDDHPNAEGHRLIFFALARALIADPNLSRLLFRGRGLTLDRSGPAPSTDRTHPTPKGPSTE